MSNAPRQARPCSAHRTTGEPCRAYAIAGGTVCVAHGGRAGQVKRAAKRRVNLARASALAGRYGEAEPVEDPHAALRAVAGRLDQLARLMNARLAQVLEHPDQADEFAVVVRLLERTLDRCRQVCVDLVRLGGDDRPITLDAIDVEIVRQLAEEAADPGGGG